MQENGRTTQFSSEGLRLRLRLRTGLAGLSTQCYAVVQQHLNLKTFVAATIQELSRPVKQRLLIVADPHELSALELLRRCGLREPCI